ncbi:MAG: dephospho-CoA kinase [Caldimicrobium sp.]|nr:dephospho-CoA kinase [Caldimicrobium sp.]MCX7873790.1 dephospho-CoA kinase [Caldimicrobium sp.]MDW8094783.1 dephospho-CoA kinase [Caldimicrobium sp.]
MTKTVAITGGIATGKSTLLRILKDLGFATLSCDDVVDSLYKKREIKEKLFQLFGKEIFLEDGNPNKKLILKKLLEDEVFKKNLENFLHPLVWESVKHFLWKCESRGDPIAFIEVPLLFEVGWDKYFDEIWVITCSEEVQRERLKVRSTPDLWLSLQKKQIPLSEKVKKAKVVLTSESTMEELKKEVKDILRGYLKEPCLL